MTFEIEIENGLTLPFDYEKIANDVVLAAMEVEKFPFEPELSLLLTDEEGIRQFNREYRKLDKATDVLSFPMADYEKPGQFEGFEDCAEEYFNVDTGEFILGDIILSIPHVYSQAESFGHSELREFAFLIAHSMLHLFGYDHMEPEEAAIMEEHQRKIMDYLKIYR